MAGSISGKVYAWRLLEGGNPSSGSRVRGFKLPTFDAVRESDCSADDESESEDELVLSAGGTDGPQKAEGPGESRPVMLAVGVALVVLAIAIMAVHFMQ